MRQKLEFFKTQFLVVFVTKIKQYHKSPEISVVVSAPGVAFY